MIVRRAKNSDIERLIELLSDVLEIHAKIRPDLFKNGRTKYTKDELAVMIEDDLNPIFVADVDGFTAGYIFCEIKDNVPTNILYGKKELYIDDLCVDAKYRGLGISKELLGRVKKYAVKEGFDSITLNVWAGNERAEAFYEKQGFFVRKTMLEMKL